MSTTRKPSKNAKKAQRREPTPPKAPSERRVCSGDKADRRIVALVRLLARLAAEQDFRDDQHER
jgi:hypothetical protein